MSYLDNPTGHAILQTMLTKTDSEMNTTFYSKKRDIGNNTFLFPFTCSDAKSIRTELRPHERSDSENKLLGTIHDRITLALQNAGYEVVRISFHSMSITAVKL